MNNNSESVPTSELFLMLENSDDISSELERLFPDGGQMSFHDYLKELMQEYGINTSELSAKTLLSRSFTYQICSGERLPNRNIILRIAIVMELPVEETQRLLKLANRGILYPRVKRDAALIYAVANKYSLYKADELLSDMGMEPLL